MKLYIKILGFCALVLSATFAYGYPLVDARIPFKNAGGCDVRHYTFADGVKKTVIILLTKQEPFCPYYYKEYNGLLDRQAVTNKVKEMDQYSQGSNTGTLEEKLDKYLKKPLLEYVRYGYRVFKNKKLEIKNNDLIEVDDVGIGIGEVHLEFDGNKRWLAGGVSSKAGSWLWNSYEKEHNYCDAIKSTLEFDDMDRVWQEQRETRKRNQTIKNIALIGGGIAVVVGLVYAAKKIYDIAKKKNQKKKAKI